MQTILYSIIATLAAAAIIAAGNAVVKKRKKLGMQFQAMMRRFFYKEKTVSQIIFAFDGGKIKNDEFIHYKDVYNRHVYPECGLKTILKHGANEKVLFLPYVECINFINDPQSSICIEDPNEIPLLHLRHGLTKETQPAFELYISKNPRTYNDRILCMKSIKETAPGRFVCSLGQADFFDVVRTNLTLDYPLKSGFRETLRYCDTDPATGNLPTLEASSMMNFIGVSAVWCMDKGSGDPSGRFYYYLKCRQSRLGVYTDVLGTASGYSNPPQSGRIDTGNLMEFMKSEILREFDEETGFGDYAGYKGFRLNDEKHIKVIPLAFTREMLRGGCPQFFFLITTPFIEDTKFAKYFKASADGRNEFRDDTLSNARSHPLSPETLVNLLYVYRYMQKNEKLGFIRL